MIIGLAGKACAGKDSVIPVFVERGFQVVDADRIGHRALDALQQRVLDRFGTVNRSELGKIVFSDRQALADLESITHPWIASQIREQVASASGNILINAALLHKQGLGRLCRLVVWVRAPLVHRVLRARRRDGWGWVRIFRRIWSQRKLGPQAFPRDVDILIVDNRGSIVDFQKALVARLVRHGVFPA